MEKESSKYTRRVATVIISKTPLRITLGGGGTDLPQFYRKEDGFWISGAIDKYIYILIKPRFEKTLRVAYSALEYVEYPGALEHPIFRQLLTDFKIKEHIEIASFADLPSRTGLGSSGTFTVGLLKALWHFCHPDPDEKEPTPQDYAERAYDVEHNKLSRPVGKQDSYSASHGWVRAYHINKKGKVNIDPQFDLCTTNEFGQHLTLFYVDRRSVPTEKILQHYSFENFNNLQKIKQIGLESLECIKIADYVTFGHLLNDHWEIKHRREANPIYSKLIQHGKSHGAIGGKLIGAGGGGFLLFVSSLPTKKDLIKSMQKKGLRHIQFFFSRKGTEVFDI